MLLDWLRRLIGPPAKQPDVHVAITITPETVIRPGDRVLLMLPGLSWQYVADVNNAAKQWLPDGAEVVVFAAEDSGAINLTRALQNLLHPYRDCRCSGDEPDAAKGADHAPDRPDDAREDSGLPVERVTGSRVLGQQFLVPEASQERIPQAHGEDSP